MNSKKVWVCLSGGCKAGRYVEELEEFLQHKEHREELFVLSDIEEIFTTSKM
jgi:hypothetical protein